MLSLPPELISHIVGYIPPYQFDVNYCYGRSTESEAWDLTYSYLYIVINFTCQSKNINLQCRLIKKYDMGRPKSVGFNSTFFYEISKCLMPLNNSYDKFFATLPMLTKTMRQLEYDLAILKGKNDPEWTLNFWRTKWKIKPQNNAPQKFNLCIPDEGILFPLSNDDINKLINVLEQVIQIHRVVIEKINQFNYNYNDACNVLNIQIDNYDTQITNLREQQKQILDQLKDEERNVQKQIRALKKQLGEKHNCIDNVAYIS